MDKLIFNFRTVSVETSPGSGRFRRYSVRAFSTNGNDGVRGYVAVNGGFAGSFTTAAAAYEEASRIVDLLLDGQDAEFEDLAVRSTRRD